MSSRDPDLAAPELGTLNKDYTIPGVDPDDT